MKTFFESVVVTFSMYSKIPMPQVAWNEKNTRFSLIIFPAVGAVIAVVLYLLFYLFSYFDLSPVFSSAAAVFLVVQITGGLHLDGYCDTIDALCSHRDQEEKLRILKDPHPGAFAVIYTAVLLVLQFGAWYQVLLTPRCLFIVLIAFILSRSLTALALVSFRCARTAGLASAFAGNTSKKAVRLVLSGYIIFCFIVMLYLDVLAAIITIILVFLSYLWFYLMAKKQFGGLTGDLSGFYIVICETVVLVTSSMIGGIIT